jgi:hypothetical protein
VLAGSCHRGTRSLKGHDRTRIGLMRNIAERTFAFLSEEPNGGAW